MSARAIWSVALWGRTAKGSALRGESVAGAADGVDQGLLEALVHPLAQPADMHVDDVGLRIEMIVPHRLEQHGAGDELALVAHQVLEQRELARLQVDGFPRPR